MRFGRSSDAIDVAPRWGLSAITVKPAARTWAIASGQGSSRVNGNAEHLTHRDADRAPVERIAACRVEKHAVDTERGCAPEDRAEVLVVVDAFEDREARRLAPQRLGPRLHQAGRRGEHAAMDGEPGDPVHHIEGHEIDGCGSATSAPPSAPRRGHLSSAINAERIG